MIRRPPRSTLFPYHDALPISGGTTRIVTYERNLVKIEGIMPVIFEQFAPLVRGMAFRVNCHARTGGVVIRFPDRKSTRLNSSHSQISYAVFCLKKKKSHITHYYLDVIHYFPHPTTLHETHVLAISNPCSHPSPPHAAPPARPHLLLVSALQISQ